MTPRGGDVILNTFRNVLFRNDEAGSMGLGGVSARELSPEGALPVNENVPRGDDVFTLLVVGALEFTPEGALRVNENDPRGDEDFIEVKVSAWEFSPEGALPVIKKVISGSGAEPWQFFFGWRQGLGRFVSFQRIDGKI